MPPTERPLYETDSDRPFSLKESARALAREFSVGVRNDAVDHYALDARRELVRPVVGRVGLELVFLPHDDVRENLLERLAHETGFWDQSHFKKMFKLERGVTPGEYRRRHRVTNY